MFYGLELSDVGPDEVLDFWFDYAKDFRPGSNEVVLSAIWTLQVIKTETGKSVDSDPASRLIGSPTIELSTVSKRNTLVVQRGQTLVDGNRYLSKCLATTDGGQKLRAFSRFWCRAAA